MANYYPLVVDAVTSQFFELPSGDTLQLSNNSMYDANVIFTGNIYTDNYYFANATPVGNLLVPYRGAGGNSEVQINVDGGFYGVQTLLITASGISTSGIKTDNYLWANGTPTPVSAGQMNTAVPGGSQYSIQYNSGSGNIFGGEGEITYDPVKNNVIIPQGTLTAKNVIQKVAIDANSLYDTVVSLSNLSVFLGNDGYVYIASVDGLPYQFIGIATYACRGNAYQKRNVNLTIGASFAKVPSGPSMYWDGDYVTLTGTIGASNVMLRVLVILTASPVEPGGRRGGICIERLTNL